MARENRFLLNNPDKFKVATVSKATKKELKSSGFQVTKTNKAIIPLKGFDKATIKKGTIIFEGVNAKTKKTIKETVTLATSKNFHDKLLSLSKKKLGRNQMLTVKIGDNAAFNNRFQNYADLFHYINNVFTPKDPGESKARLMRYMSVVEISEDRKPNAEKAQKTKDKKVKFNRRS
jgi:hypothetical protein